MKKLAVIDKDYGFLNYDGIPVISSQRVADVFNKEHNHVLRDIRELIEKVRESDERAGYLGLSKSGQIHFIKSTYIDSRNRKQTEYLLTKDGFTLLVMGYTNRKAIDFKLTYIRRYNEMENYIKNLNSCRKNYPALTSTIKMVKKNTKPFHYSNEADLINQLVLGVPAKKFKEINGLDKKISSIRPFLNSTDLFIINQLQVAGVGVFLSYPNNYKKRKEVLEQHVHRIKGDLNSGKISLIEG